MASILKPACGVDTYLFPAKDVAVSCGRLNGFVIGTLIASILTFTIIYMIEAPITQDKKQKKEEENAKIGMIAIIWAVCLLGLPPLAGFLNGRNWMVSDIELKSYMRQGMSRERATEMYAKKLMAQYQAQATRSAGMNIASALRK
tara:strand:- start:2292 stop:2726 length:435 start_codon:yes stop_codon:yes gene_type:complete